MLADRTIGYALLAVFTILYVYFVIWIGVTPFIDVEHFTQGVFPPREYGLYLSAAIMTFGFVISATVGAVHSIARTGSVPCTDDLGVPTKLTPVRANGAADVPIPQ